MIDLLLLACGGAAVTWLLCRYSSVLWPAPRVRVPAWLLYAEGLERKAREEGEPR